MPRPERFIPAGVPVHVTQRGNFQKPVFASPSEFQLFLNLLGRYAGEYENQIVGYCLLSNHFHLVAIPRRDDGVTGMMRVLNSTYARISNERQERKGHLWQARFGASLMSERHYRTALAYVDLNPVRAGLVRNAADYPWSSAAAHLGLAAGAGFLDEDEFSRMYSPADWAEVLRAAVGDKEASALRRATKLGLISGETEFVRQMECTYGRVLVRRRPGRPRGESSRASAAGD